MSDTQTSEWIEWKGGDKPPVSNDTVVQVKLRGATPKYDEAKAHLWDWVSVNEFDDIIAYRVVKP